MDNGETKGGSFATLKTIAASPVLEALWQLHYSAEGVAANNTPARYIANPPGTNGAFYLELTGMKDGSSQIFNACTNAVTPTPRYVVRRKPSQARSARSGQA